jgi:S1-C subfamily serine protease
MERVTKFVAGLTRDLVSASARPEYVKVERSEREGGARDALRVYLGTIPDYATELQGVKLSGTRGGSPADKAGLKAGDIIVEFGGQKVANIYDYTYALDAAKIGQPVKVVVKRVNERVEVTVTPEARK